MHKAWWLLIGWLIGSFFGLTKLLGMFGKGSSGMARAA